MEEIGAIYNPQSFAHVVVGDQDTNSSFAQFEDDFLNFRHVNGINSAKRFVHEEKFWFGDQSPGNFQPASLSSAQGVGFLFGKMGEPQFIEVMVDPLFAQFSFDGQGVDNGLYVIVYGQVPEHGRFLGEITYAQSGAPVHGVGSHIDVAYQHPASRCRHQADDHVKSGGFTGAIGTEQAHYFARRYLDAYFVHDFSAGVTLFQVQGGNCYRCGHSAQF